ncbi:transcription elongation factor GreA, partial [Cutibacterium avidum TM16]
ARIRQLEQMLRNAEVGEAPSTPDEVVPGSKVTVCYFDDKSDTDTFLLGSRQVMGLDDSVDISVYSPQSPLGGAVLGHSKGESTEYKAPNGKTIKVTILDVEPFQE